MHRLDEKVYYIPYIKKEELKNIPSSSRRNSPPLIAVENEKAGRRALELTGKTIFY